jgi:SAM-dependent methyltransferase
LVSLASLNLYQSLTNFRYIGAGTGTATHHVLQNLASVYKSYTFTDINPDIIKAAEDEFSKTASRMVFRPLDISSGPESQGFKPHTYDLVVAANVFHATKDLPQTLGNVRSLMKPGGYLLLVDVTNTKQTRLDFIFGALPGWWDSVGEERGLSPIISQSSWDSLLRDHQFSGIENHSPLADSDLRVSNVIVSRYMNDTMNVLEQPLSPNFRELGPWLSETPITVIGGATPASTRAVEEFKQSLPKRSIVSYSTIKGIPKENKASYVIVSELDSPLFASLDEETFSSLKVLFSSARTILWVTNSAYTENPYHAMVVGFTRTLRQEYPEVCLQILDFQDISDVSGVELASTLLRLETTPDLMPTNLLWTTEPEIRVQGGGMYIPRVKADIPRNHRYNSRNRRILQQTPLASNVISIIPGNESGQYNFQASKAISIPSDGSIQSGRVLVEVQHSLLQSVSVGDSGFLYLVYGKILDTQTSVVALSESHSSIVEVPVQWTFVPCSPERPGEYLAALAANLLASLLLAKVPSRKSIVVNEPLDFLVGPLVKQAAERNVGLRLTTTNKTRLSEQSVDNWVLLHPRPTQSMIRRTLDPDIYSFWDLSAEQGLDSLGNKLAASLPSACFKRTHADLLRPLSTFTGEETTLQGLLETTAEIISATDIVPFQSISVADITETAKQLERCTVLDWTKATSLPTLVRPIDSTDIFADQKTYVLFGLTGDLGRGLCRWMIRHGARYIVLASRNPKIDQAWLDMMKDEGATVQAHSMYAYSPC